MGGKTEKGDLRTEREEPKSVSLRRFALQAHSCEEKARVKGGGRLNKKPLNGGGEKN